MIGSVSPEMKKYIWIPTWWVVKKKFLFFWKTKKYSMYENNAVREYSNGKLTKEELDKALSILPNTTLWEFNIVGDGVYRETLEHLIQKLKLSNNVHFWGNQSNIPEILSNMDIFMHICTCEERFCIGIIEVMAAGKLFIYSNSGAIPEIITDGKDGILIEKGNIEKLTNLIIKVI